MEAVVGWLPQAMQSGNRPLVALVVALAPLLVIVALWCRARASTRWMPHPGPLFVPRHFSTWHASLSKALQRGGGWAHLMLGPQNMVAVSDPEGIKAVLLDTTGAFVKADMGDFLKSKVLLRSLMPNAMFMNGPGFAQFKALFGRSFDMERVKGLLPVFSSRIDHMFRVWRPDAFAGAGAAAAGPGAGVDARDGSFEVNVFDWAARLTLDTLGHALFHYDVGALPSRGPGGDVSGSSRRGSTVFEAFMVLFEVLGDMRASALPFYDSVPFFKHHRSLPRAMALLDGLLYDMIDREEAAWQRAHGGKAGKGGDKDKAAVSAADAAASAPPPASAAARATGKTVLAMITEDQHRPGGVAGGHPPLARHEVKGQLYLLFIAANETTSASLMWQCHYLAMHPDLQERLRAEVIGVLGDLSGADDTGGNVKYDDLTPARMPLLVAFVKEVNRIKPAGANLPSRKATRDVEVAGGRYVIPKGSLVNVSIYGAHHDPQSWPEPETFNPARFLSPDSEASREAAAEAGAGGGKRHPFAYLPFMLGPRMCLGSNFAILEQRAFVVHLLRTYRVLPPTSHGGRTHDGDMPHLLACMPNRAHVRLVPRFPAASPAATTAAAGAP